MSHIDEIFDVHMLNTDGKQKAIDLANAFTALLDAVKKVVPEGRELSVVKTKLQEACFFAKRGMATQKENQQ